MSGGLFTNQLLRETAYRKQTNHIRPLPGARELLTWLSEAGIRWTIARRPHGNCSRQSGRSRRRSGSESVVTRDQVKYAKSDPDLFLASAERLGAPIETAVVVGDSIWDMLAAIRCRASGVGFLSGG